MVFKPNYLQRFILSKYCPLSIKMLVLRFIVFRIRTMCADLNKKLSETNFKA